MAIHNLFGTSPLDSGAGYTVDSSGNAVLIRGEGYVSGGTSTHSLVGMRIYLPGGTDYTGAYAYIFEDFPFTVIHAEPWTGLAAGWNEIMFNAPYSIVEYPGGKYFGFGAYLPHGGYVM